VSKLQSWVLYKSQTWIALNPVARNSDCAGGDCALYYVALSQESATELACVRHCRGVRTDFLAQTVPLKIRGVASYSSAVVGIAGNVTTRGSQFRLCAWEGGLLLGGHRLRINCRKPRGKRSQVRITRSGPSHDHSKPPRAPIRDLAMLVGQHRDQLASTPSPTSSSSVWILSPLISTVAPSLACSNV
jgi:hypothetical protein